MKLPILLAMLIFLGFSAPLLAEGPIVCLSSSGANIDYDLANCGVPATASVFVELVGHNLLTSTTTLILTTTTQSCIAPIPGQSSNVCAIQVTNGLVSANASGGVSYQLVASWEAPISTTTIIQAGQAYTIAHESQFSLVAQNKATAGDGLIAIALLGLGVLWTADSLLRGVLK